MLAGDMVRKALHVRNRNLQSRKLRRRLIPSAFLPLRRLFALAEQDLHRVHTVPAGQTGQRNRSGPDPGNIQNSLIEQTERGGQNRVGIAVHHIGGNEIRHPRQDAPFEKLVEFKIPRKLSGQPMHHQLGDRTEAVVFRYRGVSVLGEQHENRRRREPAELCSLTVESEGDDEKMLYVLLKIDRFKFIKPVIPGDVMTVSVRKTSAGGPLIAFDATVTVDGEVRAKGSLAFTAIPRESLEGNGENQ